MRKSETIMGESGSPVDPVVEFFDHRAADYDREYLDQTPGGYALRVRRRKVLELFDSERGRVLDIGCGPGVMAQEMVDRGCEFWGVDPSLKMIEIASKRYAGNARVHFLAGDALRLALPDGFFDAALCMGVIDALSDRQAAIREMLRVLKPGGTLIVTFTNLKSPYAWWKNYVFYPAVSAWRDFRYQADRRSKAAGKGRGKRRALYTQPAARGLLESEGAEVIRIVRNYFNLFLSPLDEIMPSLALRVTRRLEETAWPKPDWLAAGFIVQAKKT